MAIRINNKPVIDTKPDYAVGIDLPLNADNVFYSNYTTAEAIKYNLINFLLTNKGERVFNPTFGANLQSMIFSQSTQTNIESVEANVRNQISLYFPSVVINQLLFTPYPDQNLLVITFKYSIPTLGIDETINLNFETNA
jgi:phage baseplate assembly protein W